MARQTARPPDASTLASVQELYDRGRTLDALRRAEAFAPLPAWDGVEGCVLAARIAANAGAPRLARRLALRAWKLDRSHPEALLQYGYELLSRRGPLALWRLAREWRQRGGDGDGRQAEVLALEARAAGDLRDFATAEALVVRAESLEPGRAWIRLQRAHLLEAQDRVEEALEVAAAARELHPHPFYRPGVQTSAHLLQLLDRDDAAIGLLREADAELQNGPVASQLYSLLSENGRFEAADAALERFLALTPLLEAEGQRWVTSQRARVAYRLRRRARAAELAAQVPDEFHARFAERLAAPHPTPERVQLDVDFVRQHFKTCAPATLAAIGRFFGMPPEHLKLAEAVCYDGTPAWQQREWAEENGWCVREFRVSQESAVALVEREIPFAISTVAATSAHMMAVMGFDRTRGTLLLRDPSQPYVIETYAEEFFARHRAFGPRGMVFVPAGESARLDGAGLPEAALYDGLHGLCLALSRHDRAGAAATLQRMEEEAADAALTWEARLALASYDGNHAEQARCLDRLLELFPNEPARQLRRLEGLQGAAREERIHFLEGACRAPNADPALFVALARALQGDARRHGEARRWLGRALRLRPTDSAGISALADLLWEEGRLDEATELYRFAANLEGFREHLYQTWFLACRRTRRTAEALAHLEDRFARFGSRSEQPALTLAWAWGEMEQPARARAVLDQAILLRPDDGALLLRAATLVAALGEAADAQRLLDAARGRVRENDWLRAAAEIAESRLDLEASLGYARALLEREPLALDAHARVARASARREGTAAALAQLRRACAEFPHHCGLQRMVLEWSREAGPESIEAAARELLRLEPSDAWARRELALALASSKRAEDALQEAAEAARIEPRNSYSHSILGHIHRQLGNASEARAAYRRAVAQSVDNGDALGALLGLASTDAERKQELAFIEQELIAQVVSGDGLLAYLELARPMLDPEPLLANLRQAHAERPDLWHAWSALVSQLGHLGRYDEALALARQAGERFPHLPRIWLDLAMVHRWRDEPDAEIEAAERAFEVNPAWNPSALALAAALERCGRMADARRVYERALRHAPQDAQLHAAHAHLLWRERQGGDAFAALERALRLAPGYGWAWELLSDWAGRSGQPERTAELARRLTQERPGEARVWLMLARALLAPDAGPERLAAVERALELDRRSAEAWDLEAELLADEERFDAAIEACDEGAAACAVDAHILRGRRAWVLARRRLLPEAVSSMRAVLAENASYVWGWHQLATWLLEQGALADAASALEQVQRLRPRDAWVSRQLGVLRVRQEDGAGAQQAFAAALRLEPTDRGAAHSLFDLQLRASDLAGAAATLEVMQIHQPGAATLAMDALLRLQRAESESALEPLEALCASPDPEAWPLDTAVDAFQRAGRAREARRVLERAMRSGSCNPGVAAAAIRLMLAEGSALAATRLFLRLEPGAMRQRAAETLIPGLGQRRSGLLLRWLLWRRGEVLRQDDAAWGQVGFASSSLGRWREVARWLADWRQRSGVQPWMLFNLCLALRHLGRCDEANEVARHVLATWGHREGSADMRLFLAVEEALAGEVPAAEEHLRQVVVRNDVAHDRQLLALARGLVALQQTPPAERRQRSAALRAELAREFGAWRVFSCVRDVRRTFRRSAHLFQREGAGPRAWLWFRWRLYWHWLLAPFALVAVVSPPLLIGLLVAWLVLRRDP